MSSDFANAVLNGVYEELGLPAFFAPKSGAQGQDCLVLADQGDGSYNLGGFDVTAVRNIYTVRRSEIPIIVVGDIITFPAIDGTDYKVNAAPRLLDSDKAEWTLELVEVSA
ncbi:hypothetical protein DES40_1723 [Litorimonas taeanensis]|uniref:Uncharacterized protein n=1 Tax=Litorimonas taeanensis TaxID=568099 RepID=A0A420WD56_9PROT|nr:hypothetical protein [Litorimonas taeanensis]RKQ68947.1 hypothetical protein DES40_1723 [Litorimonas taeanensis]